MKEETIVITKKAYNNAIKRIRKQDKENIELQERINKAIEMIKLTLIQENKTLYQNELEWLLEILQGE